MDKFAYIDTLINRIQAFASVRKSFMGLDTSFGECVEQFGKEFDKGDIFLCFHAAKLL